MNDVARQPRAHVTGWGRYAPAQVLTNKDLERMVDTSDEWIVTRTGIRERRVAAANETTASMAAVASLRAIRTAGIDPDDIDLILLATLTPDYWMPSTAALVKEAIGNTRAAAMDVAAACSGFVYAFATAQAYIASGIARHVLVIGAELLTRFLDYTDRSTCILFGDGAGAVVLSASRRAGWRARDRAHDRAAGRLHDLAAGRRCQEPAVCRDDRARRALHPDGGQGDVPVRDEDDGHHRAGVGPQVGTGSPSDIDLFIPHQANIRIVEAVAKGLDLPMDKMYVNLDRYGNTSAASVPIALAEAVNEGRVKIGDRIVMVAFGAGFTSGAVTVEWTADPARGRAGDAAVNARRRPGPPAGRLGLGRPDPTGPGRGAARPGRVDVPLDDVVPANPNPPHSEVHA